MPLTPYQAEVARILAQGRSSDSYLAGGAALHLLPNSLRYSNDLDYFNDTFAGDKAALERAGHELQVLLDKVGFVRAVVSRSTERTKVEWVHDTAWRFLPVVHREDVGYLLHPIDLAVNKVLALVGREEPRDYLDVIYSHQHILPLGPLVWAAAGKDPGFSPPMLIELLRRKGRYRPEDFRALRLVHQPNLIQLKSLWLEALDVAESYVAFLPAEELGCLYFDACERRFVARGANASPDVVPHFGRPGGVVPLIDAID